MLIKEKTQKWLLYTNNDPYQFRKIFVFQKVLKTATSTPPPPAHPSKVFSRRKSHLATAVICN